jgi:hypothetical protein
MALLTRRVVPRPLPEPPRPPEPQPAAGDTAEDTPALSFHEHQAIKLIFRLEQILQKATLTRVTWIWVHHALLHLAAMVSATLAVTEDVPAEKPVPLTGSLPVLEEAVPPVEAEEAAAE